MSFKYKSNRFKIETPYEAVSSLSWGLTAPPFPSPIWLDTRTIRLSWWQDGTWAVSLSSLMPDGCDWSHLAPRCHWGMADPACFGTSTVIFPWRMGVLSQPLDMESLLTVTLHPNPRLLGFSIPGIPRNSIFFAFYILWCEIPSYTVPTLLTQHHVELACKMLLFFKELAF